jgi:hypothetical protein
MISHKSKGFVYPEYISPLPADEFIKGALLKQQMYDEGVEKVQQQLDTYGQIRKNLLKEEDKAYFDQEATKLVNTLNKNAGLDFANKNNLRSALSLGKNLVNDPVIANASESAATYQKMMDEYRKLDPKNRSSVNDYFFFKDLNGWLKDGKTGSKLNYNSYTVYTDEHVKLWKELSTSLKPEEAEYPVFDPKDNKWIIQKKYSGVTAQRFRDAYMNGLSAQAKAQLDMEARYTLETGDKDQITSFYTQDLNNKLTSLNLELEKDTQQLAETNAKYGDKSPEALRIKERITSATNALNFYQEKQSKELSDSDLIGFLRDDKVLDAAGSFAYKNESSKLEANPYVVDYYKMQNNIAEARAKAEIDIAKEAELVRRGLKDGATGAALSMGSYLPDTKYNSSPVIQDLQPIYGQTRSNQEAALIQNGLVKFSEGKTVEQALQAIMDENKISGEDRRDINEMFLPSGVLERLPEAEQRARQARGNRLVEEMFWKFKGIYQTLTGNKEIEQSDKDKPSIKLSPSDTVSVQEMSGGVRDMSVSSLLNRDGSYLSQIKEIRIKTLNK